MCKYFSVIAIVFFEITSVPAQVQDSSSKKTIIDEIQKNMVLVEAGTFKMGCTQEQGSECNEGEKPAHTVILKSFQISKFEVTQQLYKAVMDTNPAYHQFCAKCPVEQVSWEDCQNFIRILDSISGKHFRLPTEAEWEFAARGGNKSQQYKYSGSNTNDSVGWDSDNSNYRTHIVGDKKSNELTLFDMSGNVSEWCNDRYGKYIDTTLVNPTGPVDGDNRRIARGGSYHQGGGRSSASENCRVSCRELYSPVYKEYYIGFRIASDE